MMFDNGSFEQMRQNFCGAVKFSGSCGKTGELDEITDV